MLRTTPKKCIHISAFEVVEMSAKQKSKVKVEGCFYRLGPRRSFSTLSKDLVCSNS